MENKMTQEIIEKAKMAQSAEEILTLAKESGYEMSDEEANEYFEQLHKTGELSDEELGSVAGGGCQMSVNGTNYTIVTSRNDCFTGQYKDNFLFVQHGNVDQGYTKTVYSHDRKDLRAFWRDNATTNQCGTCGHLQFKPGTCTGYCDQTGK